MIDMIVQALQAGDGVLKDMGAFTGAVLAMIAGMSLTQVIKFPIAKVLGDGWREWTIRITGIIATWSIARLIVSLPAPLPVITALAQPFVYTGAMAVIRHFWPWMEAGKLVGSAAPSEEAVAIRAARKGVSSNG